MNHLLNVLLAAWHLLLESSVYILFGLLVSGLLRVFLDPSAIAGHLGRGRISSGADCSCWRSGWDPSLTASKVDATRSGRAGPKTGKKFIRPKKTRTGARLPVRLEGAHPGRSAPGTLAVNRES